MNLCSNYIYIIENEKYANKSKSNFLKLQSILWAIVLFPVIFLLLNLTVTTAEEFRTNNLSSILYPYFSTPIGDCLFGNYISSLLLKC